jgi:hypothetical protein
MEYIYAVYESGCFEFVGTLSECEQYISNNLFKDNFFQIVRV